MAVGSSTTTQDPVTLVYELKLESNSDRNKFHAQWAKNKQLDGGDHYAGVTLSEDNSALVINLTRNAINGVVSVMTETKPESNIIAVEKDSPGIYYIKREAGAQIHQSLPAIIDGVTNGEIPPNGVLRAAVTTMQQLSEEQLLGDEPILPEQFRSLSNSINPLTEQPFLTDESVYRFDDITVADLLQRGVDGVWNRYKWEKKVEGFERDALVIGHRDVIVEYDDDIDDVRLHVVLERDSWIDPNPIVKDIQDAQHYIYAQVLDVEAAVKKFPKHEEAIRANAEDPGSATSGNGELLSDRYTDIDWQRDMAVIYTAWIKDQTMEIKNGDVVDTVRGLREIRMVGSTLLSDGPSRYQEIPVTRFKFITITDSSYSVGLPEMLQDPQKTVNRLFSNLSDHTQFLPHPQSWMLQSVVDVLSNKDVIFGRSNDPITIPDATVEDIKGDPIKFIDPPSLDPSHIAFLNIAISMFHDLANQGEVNRGIATSKAESGVAIDALQQAGNRVVNLASKDMDHATARLNELTYRHMVDFMPPEKWREYTDKYPLNVLTDMLRRAQKAEFNVKVATAGTQQQRRVQEQQKTLLMRQNGAISLKTFLQKMEIDNPEQEAQKIIQEQTEAASAQAQIEQQAKQQEFENEIKLEAAKAEFEMKNEQLKAELELRNSLLIEQEKAKLQPDKPKSEKASA